MKAKLIWLILILGVSGAIIGYRMWNKPHQDIAASDSTASLTAPDLLKAYQTDEATANAKYLNKIITVNGSIEEVRKESDQITIHLGTDDAMATVICNLDPFSGHDGTELITGRNITMKGVCSGMLTDVVLDRCVIVNPSSN